MDRPALKTALLTRGHTKALKDGTVRPRGFDFAFEEVPQIIQAFSGLSDLLVGFVSAIPYLAAAIGMVIIGKNSGVSPTARATAKSANGRWRRSRRCCWCCRRRTPHPG